MTSIPQTGLFCWKDIENLGDLKRFKLVLEVIPDESLMRIMEAQRGRGRDDYPIRAMWNSLLAGVIFQHDSGAALRRELRRNDRLRWMCGFDPVKRLKMPCRRRTQARNLNDCIRNALRWSG